MPKGYIIAHIDVEDPEAFADYVRLDTPILEGLGGRFIIRGGTTRQVEGATRARHVVLEFPDYATALKAWDDADYQSVAEIRRRSAQSDILIVEGTE